MKFTLTNKGNPNAHTWQNTLYQRLELLDARATSSRRLGDNWHNGGGNSVTMTITYNGNNGPDKPARRRGSSTRSG